jgi:hypothetical protein
MSAFTSNKSYAAGATFIPYAVERIRNAFVSEGFEFSRKSDSYSRTVIQVTKGNLFVKAVGLKQGLEISFTNEDGRITVEARGTVLKDQFAASMLTLLVAWPVVIPQIIGMVRQSGLDDRAIGIADAAYADYCAEKPSFCPHCGAKVSGNPGRCPHCGGIL